MTNNSLSFAELTHANIDRCKEWTNHAPESLEYCMIQIAGETGELAEAVKKLLRLRNKIKGGWSSEEEAHQQIKDEAADVVIALNLLAIKMNFDLGDAIRQKFNKTSEKFNFQRKL